MRILHPLEIYRQDQQISRSELAEKLEISPSYMTRLLCGERLPGGGLVARVERLTDGKITAADFYSEEAAS
jgi:transcriptional regulator with XRE-family HTH domain